MPENELMGLTLLEPWASCVALGIKRVETRSFPLPESYIGKPLAIHAGRHFDCEERLFARYLQGHRGSAYDRYHRTDVCLLPPDWQPQLGKLLCVVTPYRCIRVNVGLSFQFIDCADQTAALLSYSEDSPQERLLGDWSPGRYLWLLKDARRIKPVEFRGRQRFFKVPSELVEYVDAGNGKEKT